MGCLRESIQKMGSGVWGREFMRRQLKILGDKRDTECQLKNSKHAVRGVTSSFVSASSLSLSRRRPAAGGGRVCLVAATTTARAMSVATVRARCGGGVLVRAAASCLYQRQRERGTVAAQATCGATECGTAASCSYRQRRHGPLGPSVLEHLPCLLASRASSPRLRTAGHAAGSRSRRCGAQGRPHGMSTTASSLDDGGHLPRQ
jgi:hypothetical protein